MSKIERALERAKKMRQEGQPQVQDEGLVAEMPSLQGQEPVYTKTQVMSPDKGHLEKNRVMTLLDNPEVMDQYSLLRTQILQRTRQEGHNTIMVTSVLEGEGKTVTAINLAVSMAREVNQTVMLVDTDLRHPKIHKYLGLNVDKGLSDYLQTDVSVAELLVNPGLAKMVVLPAGKALRRSTEILGSPKMKRLVEEMKRRYPERYVIFDCPPVLSVADALVFSSYVDGVILVVEAGRTPREQISKAVELLEDANIIGLVMNRAEVSSYGYYY
jgi:exopolysaccharide/PEP-CTERM locus tyrosine autokinase